MTDKTHPLAALLAGVPRYSFTGKKLQENGWMHEDAVLAALPAVTPPDVAKVVEEAGKVLEGVTPGPWVVWDGDICPQNDASNAIFTLYQDTPEADARFIAWCREGVPTLIALATAQAAQIAGLEGGVEASCQREAETERKLRTALAAERAKTARLVERAEVVCQIEADRGQRAGEMQYHRGAVACRNAIRAALSEAEART